MNSLKKTIRNFFGTTRAQTNGFVGLLLVIGLAIFSQPLTRWWISTRPQDFSKDAAVLDSLTHKWKLAGEKPPVEIQPEAAITYFDFDPNVASFEELKLIGFSEKLATQVIKYRTKGGTFRTKPDMLKLYGMDSILYEKISPYIQLPDRFEKRTWERKEFNDRAKPREKPPKFNLNEADTLQLEKIYGIGPTLARRIIRYRERLGGFISQEQLLEVYGLDTAVVGKIREASYLPDPPAVKKINLNTADEQMMAAHPYFGRKIARTIVTYRFQHGNFKSVDDLGKIPLMDKTNLGKLFPYVTVDP